ncbi:UNVERIFIED_ORG: putative RNase H-like nuclease [Actinomadura viridilutea]
MGVDACRTGWIGVVLDDDGPAAWHAPEIGALARAAAGRAPLDVIAVDIPIGLADAGPRQADVLAREAAGRRWQSVFLTPVRSALEAGDHAAATRKSRRITGTGVSAQAYALRSRILEVDRWVHRAGTRVVEVHPEVCFAEMAASSGGALSGEALPAGKKSWAGMRQRAALLARQGIVLASDFGRAGALAGADDVLDAAAAAWTARRVARGEARSLPDPPQVFSDGLPCAIWI